MITNLRMDLRFKLYHQVVRLHFEKMRISSRTPIKEPEDECGDSLVLYDADWADPQRILKVDTTTQYAVNRWRCPGLLLPLLRGPGEHGLRDHRPQHVHQLPLPKWQLLG